ncbi:MAG: hypothetical protein EHM31_13230, partial [Candidatus Aminicenantes bacterium]
MKHKGIVLALVLIGGLAVSVGTPTIGAAPDGRGPVALIRIAKTPALPVQILTRLQIDVRQELATCRLAFADRDDINILRRNGVRFTVLDRNAARREYLVVGIADPGALASLRAAGHAVPVEPATAVFWTDEGSALEAVPAGLPRKAFPPRSVRMRPDSAPTPSVSMALAQDPLVETIVSLVSSSNLAASVQMLQDFQTRYASTTNCEAAGEALFAA